MEIVSIFAPKLYAFNYEDEVDNEFDRLMDLWTDASNLQAYALKHKVKNLYEFIDNILLCAEEIQDFLEQLSQGSQSFQFYFEPLQESEKYRILSLQKGKKGKNQLRLYAIKIEEDCFVITGGAIKMSQKMQEHPDTARELEKLEKAKNYLMENDVSSEETFFELLNIDI